VQAAAAAARYIEMVVEERKDKIAAPVKNTGPAGEADTVVEGIGTPSPAIEAGLVNLPSSFQQNQTPGQTAEVWLREEEDPTT
jgi:hypothetical protein